MGLFTPIENTVDRNFSEARRVARNYVNQWENRGGELTREDIYSRMIGDLQRMGLGPEYAHAMVYNSGIFPDMENMAGGLPSVGQMPETTFGSFGGSGGSSINYAKLREDYERNKQQAIEEYQLGLLDFEKLGRGIGTARGQAGEAKQEGLGANQAYFSQISPDAFQSQLVDYNQKVTGAYDAAMKDLQFQENQGNVKRDLYDRGYKRQRAQLESDYAENRATGYTPGSTGIAELDPMNVIKGLSDYYEEAIARFGPDAGYNLTKKFAKSKTGFGLSEKDAEYYTDKTNLEKWLQQNQGI